MKIEKNRYKYYLVVLSEAQNIVREFKLDFKNIVECVEFIVQNILKYLALGKGETLELWRTQLENDLLYPYIE